MKKIDGDFYTGRLLPTFITKRYKELQEFETNLSEYSNVDDIPTLMWDAIHTESDKMAIFIKWNTIKSMGRG